MEITRAIQAPDGTDYDVTTDDGRRVTLHATRAPRDPVAWAAEVLASMPPEPAFAPPAEEALSDPTALAPAIAADPLIVAQAYNALPDAASRVAVLRLGLGEVDLLPAGDMAAIAGRMTPEQRAAMRAALEGA